ncbi:hypothetical protein CSIRO_2340 [Bradyrhizobiaceae bacterium SG-6C]|nr:hypothetical protein CSIRO_2340 [Bradyrhizobiaceae bacterium SG-6C]
MIALLIGGTVVLCIGLLTVVFGIPIKEFSLGSTMILAGSVVSCAGLLLIGLYALGREIRALTRRLEAGLPAPSPAVLPRESLPREPLSREPLSRDPVAEAEAAPAAVRPPRMPPEPQPVSRPRPPREDTLFTRDQPADAPRDEDDFGARDTHNRPTEPPAWEDHPVTRSRPAAPSAEPFDAPQPEPAPRQRRNIMFSSSRRDKSRDLQPREDAPADDALPGTAPVTEEPPRGETETSASDPFDRAWPQPSRPRHEPRREAPGERTPPVAEDATEPARERFPLPRRADTSSVTIVKSGVVDSMAYSLYSDGSIEAQMPEGMVRFASIDELRAHLDQRN